MLTHTSRRNGVAKRLMEWFLLVEAAWKVKLHGFLPTIFLCVLLSGCGHLVNISYPREAVMHPVFNQRFTTWEGERVQVALTPSLHGDAFTCLANYDQVLLANLIRERGLRHEYHTAGNGTPIVVYSRNPEATLRQKHYPTSGIVLGITAVKEDRPGKAPVLKLYDAFDPVVVQSAHSQHPIAANYTATVAVLFSHARRLANSSAEAFLRPDNPRFATGIYLIHPYDPNKIPILFVHGLISSPISWQNLTNDLCSDPKILERYQPWFFLYPTGQPALESAEQLREDLQATQRLFDPKGIAVTSHHVVVIAHSLGGILAHTLVSDSGDSLWNSFATKPFDSLVLPPEEKKLLAGYFFIRHQSCIDRVIFLAVPHRGSRLAAGIVGSIGNRLIRRPRAVVQAMRELATEDPGTLRPYFARVGVRGGPTSLISLAPNPLLASLAALPIRVPFHSIIGDRGRGDGMRSSDGVVRYSSSHLAGAESEIVVPAGHLVFSNPAAVLEIKRILEENLNSSGIRKRYPQITQTQSNRRLSRFAGRSLVRNRSGGLQTGR
jgi:pimeloyl-ACP methyl ester carboxylesterase